MAIVEGERFVTVEIKNDEGEIENEYEVNLSRVMQPIEGNPERKHLLSVQQLTSEDIMDYIREAKAAEAIIRNPRRLGIDLMPHVVLAAVMRQASTRTAGTMATAMEKLGGVAHVFSGMSTSSEAKGESLPDSWVALATQSDIIGTRTKEQYGPALAAQSINQAFEDEQLWFRIPVINLGDGTNEHVTQFLGDSYTINKEFGDFEGLTAGVVGAHGEYRAHHSFLLGANILGMKIVAVESEASPVPGDIAETLGDNLTRVGADDLDEIMPELDVLYMGRRPDEYINSKNPDQVEKSRQLTSDYQKWTIDYQRLQQMKLTAIEMHPRPRRDEVHPSVDRDHRTREVQQMATMVPMRMAIIARHMGRTITGSASRI
jgi:aspartate carbamoyltransferase catalytic subunit